MASISSVSISVSLRSSTPAYSGRQLLGVQVNVFNLSRRLPVSVSSSPRLIVAFTRRPKSDSAITNKKNVAGDGDKEDGVDEDAFDALFAQLDEDLKLGSSVADEDEELTEEDLAILERELEEALVEDDDLFKLLGGEENDDGDEDENENEEDEDGDEDKFVKLKSWQLRRLARALKVGRRKTSIKSLTGELCLDRSFVLNMLRDPPPKLLMMSAALPDEPVRPKSLEPEVRPVEVLERVSVSSEEKTPEAVSAKNVPVHEMRSQWSTQKRLKKVQVETLERVYRRTMRPTNAMVSSIVHVTNLPRKKVLKWFEDKRNEDGVPNERCTPETVFSG